jgi:tRNA(Ile2)-agmatinylcytidine synthase
MAAVVEGTICKGPMKIHGGHVISRLSDGSGEIDVAAYEPSAGFRNALAALVQGDAVRAHGGVKLHGQDGITLNLERMEVVDLVRVKGRNPRCQGCGKSMKSEGKGKGYQCRRCGRKELTNVLDGERKISVGNYLPPPKAMRHLTKPLKRYGHEKSGWSGPPEVFYGVF